MHKKEFVIFALLIVLISSFASADISIDLDPVVTIASSSDKVCAGESIQLLGVAYDSGSGVCTLQIAKGTDILASKNCGGLSSCSLSASDSEQIGTYTYTAKAWDCGDNSEDDETTVTFEDCTPQIPEFNSFTSIIALAGAFIGLFFLRRKK